MTNSDEPTGSIAPGVSRRRFLQATGLGAAAAAAAGLSGGPAAAADSSTALPAGWSGTIHDVKHVVILMQENRSFDHYFGTLRGVRGFGDKQILTYANGTSVFAQADKGRTDLGYLLPYNLTDQVDGDLDHSWVGDHAARNGGLWNNWVAAKTEETNQPGRLHGGLRA
jgi:phospholipase C